MKSRLNITVEETLLNNAKRYASRNQTSLSQLIELYFKSLIRPSRKKNILELLKELPKPKVKIEGDLKENYYEQRKKKYGF
jgi:Family of unknown function (DUF6364)